MKTGPKLFQALGLCSAGQALSPFNIYPIHYRALASLAKRLFKYSGPDTIGYLSDASFFPGLSLQAGPDWALKTLIGYGSVSGH